VLLSAVVIAMMVQIALTVKHYFPRYALPAMLMSGLANAMCVLLLESLGFHRTVKRAFAATGTVLLLLCVVHTVYSA